MGKTRDDIIKEVNADFKKYNIWCDAEPNFTLVSVIDVDVDGDWKHYHLAVSHIMEEHGCVLIGKKMIGESDDDCYHAVHHYAIND